MKLSKIHVENFKIGWKFCVAPVAKIPIPKITIHFQDNVEQGVCRRRFQVSQMSTLPADKYD